MLIDTGNGADIRIVINKICLHVIILQLKL